MTQSRHSLKQCGITQSEVVITWGKPTPDTQLQLKNDIDLLYNFLLNEFPTSDGRDATRYSFLVRESVKWPSANRGISIGIRYTYLAKMWLPHHTTNFCKVLSKKFKMMNLVLYVNLFVVCEKTLFNNFTLL